jgi:uncharacterized membrane protein
MFVILTAFFFWQIITPNNADRAVIKGDFGPVFYSYRLFAARSLRNGSLPLWNPHDYGGMPFLADPQSAVFYPFNLLLTLFVRNDTLPLIALEFQLILHIFLAGLFTYLFARTIGLKRFPSFISGVTFMFTGFMAAHMEHLVIINAITWLPLILLFLEKGLRQGKLRYSVPAGWAFGLSIMAGHYQMALYVALGVLIYVIFRLAWAFQDGDATGSLLRKGSLYPLMVMVGLAVSAVQLIPALKLIGRSYRSAVDYQFSTTRDQAGYRCAQKRLSFPQRNFLSRLEGLR